MTRYAADEELNSQIKKIIGEARRVMSRAYNRKDYPALDFDAPRWDLNKCGVSKTTHGHFARFYTIDGTAKKLRQKYEPDDAMPSVFSDVVKCWLVLHNMSTGYMDTNSTSLRYLWKSLASTHKSRFLWDRLSVSDLLRAAKYIEEQYPKSAYHHESCWGSFLKWLRQNEVIGDDIEWTPSAADRHARGSADHRKRRRDRLPQREVLAALGKIYCALATATMDRLVICAIGLLFVAGFRSGELMTLPDDCWVEEMVQGRKRCGLRYWAEKDKEGQVKASIRWLSPLGAELAKACLAEIKLHTRKARAQARALESAPQRIRLKSHANKLWLTRAEAAEALDMKPGSLAALIRHGHLKLTPRITGYRKWTYSRKQIEAELLRRRPPLNTLQISPRRFQKLSQTLLITFVYETDPQASTSRVLVRRLPESALHIFLGTSKVSTPSAFERFGFANKLGGDEGRLRLRLHAVRHWLNTVANNAGMTAFQITVWMQRSSVEQTMLYLHDSADIADYTCEMMRQGRAAGPIVDDYLELNTTEAREDFLKTIRDAHLTATTTCCRSYSTGRCGRAKACEAGCERSLAIVGDRRPLTGLRKKRDALKAAIKHLDVQRRQGVKVVGRQRTLCVQMLRAVNHRIQLAEVSCHD